jgi:DNA topoisomerase-1
MAKTTKSGKKLIIVESPHKASVIQKFLGKEYMALASAGHIRDLPKSGRGKKGLGIDVENNFAMHYEIIKGKEKTVDELKKAVSNAAAVYLAPDPDREGEAIAWHLKEALNLKENQAKRITYQSVTKKAVLEALENAHDINMNLVNAQQARRALDRLVGFSLSPFLWKKVAKNLSAGRVQSPAVRMVVEREKEIAAFKTEEYWSVSALIEAENQKKTFIAQLSKYQGKKYGLGHPMAANAEKAESIIELIKKHPFILTSVETKEAKSKPGAPFITSTLQQAANTFLRFSTKRTMVLAQKLYEGVEIDGNATGLITYMRTDSTYIDPAAQEEAKAYILERFGQKYLPAKPNIYTSKNSQEAHEGIRPTSMAFTPEKVKNYLNNDEFRLYELIWRRFIQSQMVPAVFSNTTAQIEAGEALFEAKGRVLVFDGYLALQKDKENDENDEKLLPPLTTGEPVKALEVSGEQHFTKPPARYSEASLVKALEKEGIGRPSTYAPIIQTILERGYVIQKNRMLYATELGMAVNLMLEKNFDDIVNYHFTADMENKLDAVENGKENWVSLLSSFYTPFKNEVETALEKAEPLKGQPWQGEELCPLCGKPLVVRYSKAGAFLGCSNYPECKGLLPMPGQTGDAEDDETTAEKATCPECGSAMVLKRSRYGKAFFACSRYPDCKTTLSVDKDGKPVAQPKTDKICDKCGKPMVIKVGRRGAFLACSAYPECKNVASLDSSGNVETPPAVENPGVCEKCGSEMVVKKGRGNWFLACSAYPKCRNAKPLPKEGEEETAPKPIAKKGRTKKKSEE